MANRKVEPGDWVKVSHRDAVVCTVFEEPVDGDIEVVFLDGRNRAINTEAVWRDDSWQFASDGPSDGYADNYTRLRNFVAILRAGNRFKTPERRAWRQARRGAGGGNE